VFLYWYVRQGLELMRFDRTQSVLYLALLFQCMVINMSESNWFSRDSNFTILTLATACMARALFEHRQRATMVEPTTGARPDGDRTSKPAGRLVNIRRGHAQRRKG
jgi:hypothetical protein